MNAFFTLSIRGLGSVGNLLLLVLITILYGEIETGKIVSSIAMSWLIAIISGFGIQRYVLFRFNRTKGTSFGKLLPLFVIFLFVSSVITIIGCLLIALGHFRIGMATLIGGVILPITIIAEYNICIARPNFSFLLSTAMAPLITASVLSILWIIGVQGVNVLTVLYASYLSVLLIACRVSLKNFQLLITLTELHEIFIIAYKDWRRLVAYWYSSVSETLLTRIFPLLAPFFLNYGDVGQISIVLSLAAFGGTILQVGRALYGPTISKISAERYNRHTVTSLLWRTQLTTFTMALLIYLPMAIMSHSFTLIFGMTNAELMAYLILVVSVSQIARLFFGIPETVLTLGNHPWLEAFLITLSPFFIVTIVWILGIKEAENWVYAIMSVMLLRTGMAYYIVSLERFHRDSPKA